MLDTMELNGLSVNLSSLFMDSSKVFEIISILNRTGQLDSLLNMLGIVNNDSTSLLNRRGKIVIVGDSEVSKQQLEGIAKECGIEKSRLEFCLDYFEAKRFNFRKLQYNENYCAVLAGPMPHSTWGKDEFSSSLVALEKLEGYPPVARLGSNCLKITKSNFKSILLDLLSKGVISCWKWGYEADL